MFREGLGEIFPVVGEEGEDLFLVEELVGGRIWRQGGREG